LKHVEGVEFVPERGFRRTCEGLKLAVGIALDATEDGFRRTCEGLKRLWYFLLRIFSTVSDGPVRD